MNGYWYPEEVVAARVAERRRLEADVEYLRDVLSDLVAYTDGHRLSYESHDHDCFQEWTLLRDEARSLLAEQSSQEDGR